jgi:hypothetical protein
LNDTAIGKQWSALILLEMMVRVLKQEMRSLLRETMRTLKQPAEQPYRVSVVDEIEKKENQTVSLFSIEKSGEILESDLRFLR